MQFANPILNHTVMPDPLWLYKAGTSLMYHEVEAQAAKNGRTLAEQATVSVDYLKEALSRPNAKARGATGIESLIEAITHEAAALYDAIALPTHNLKKEVAEAVLKTYSDMAGLVHMHRTGQIAAEELRLGALLKMKELDRFGANGLAGFIAAFDTGSQSLLERLQTDTRVFTPKWIQGTSNNRGHSLSRAQYFASEYEYAAPKTQEAYEAFLNKITPQLMGAGYDTAVGSKEKLLAQHITSGKLAWGDDIFVTAASIHRNNDYLQGKAHKKAKTPEFDYVNDALKPSQETLARIRAGEAPQSFLEVHDAAISDFHPNQSEIASDLSDSLSFCETSDCESSDIIRSMIVLHSASVSELSAAK